MGKGIKFGSGSAGPSNGILVEGIGAENIKSNNLARYRYAVEEGTMTDLTVTNSGTRLYATEDGYIVTGSKVLKPNEDGSVTETGTFSSTTNLPIKLNGNRFVGVTYNKACVYDIVAGVPTLVKQISMNYWTNTGIDCIKLDDTRVLLSGTYSHSSGGPYYSSLAILKIAEDGTPSLSTVLQLTDITTSTNYKRIVGKVSDNLIAFWSYTTSDKYVLRTYSVSDTAITLVDTKDFTSTLYAMEGLTGGRLFAFGTYFYVVHLSNGIIGEIQEYQFSAGSTAFYPSQNAITRISDNELLITSYYEYTSNDKRAYYWRFTFDESGIRLVRCYYFKANLGGIRYPVWLNGEMWTVFGRYVFRTNDISNILPIHHTKYTFIYDNEFPSEYAPGWITLNGVTKGSVKTGQKGFIFI